MKTIIFSTANSTHTNHLAPTMTMNACSFKFCKASFISYMSFLLGHNLSGLWTIDLGWMQGLPFFLRLQLYFYPRFLSLWFVPQQLFSLGMSDFGIGKYFWTLVYFSVLKAWDNFHGLISLPFWPLNLWLLWCPWTSISVIPAQGKQRKLQTTHPHQALQPSCCNFLGNILGIIWNEPP